MTHVRSTRSARLLAPRRVPAFHWHRLWIRDWQPQAPGEPWLRAFCFPKMICATAKARPEVMNDVLLAPILLLRLDVAPNVEEEVELGTCGTSMAESSP